MFKLPPETLQEYLQVPSAKIDAIIAIIQHHQLGPDRAPLNAVAREPLASPPNTFTPTTWQEVVDAPTSGSSLTEMTPSMIPDKIVLFIAFPEHNEYIKAVRVFLFLVRATDDDVCQIFRFHNIETMEVHGAKSRKSRSETLKAFRESTRPSVLIVSSVGTTGLNLDCACILIVAVNVLFFICLFLRYRSFSVTGSIVVQAG